MFTISNQPIYVVGILVAAVVALVLGSVWYSPAIFGNRWKKLVAGSPKQSLAVQFILSFLFLAIQALIIQLMAVFAHTFISISSLSLTESLDFYQPSAFLSGLYAGFLAWVLVAAVTLANTFSEGTRKKLWLINAGYLLLAYTVMGLVIGYFISTTY